jgi:hypothetical protein
MSKRSEALAVRLEQGAAELAELANALTEEQLDLRVKDGRKIRTVVHHVASMYPIEMELAQLLAAGKAVTGVTWKEVHAINKQHATEFENVSKADAIALLRVNSAKAAAQVRLLTDFELDNAAPLSLNANAPLTCQFMLEDHPVRHSYWHLAAIRAVVGLVLVPQAA